MLKKQIAAFCVICILFTETMTSLSFVHAASPKTITLKQVGQLALANSKEYKRTLNKIEMQQTKYVAAVKSIQLKKKNMATFRWTPLLSFKFPQQPDLADAYEWQYKPIQITCQIDVLRHNLNDVKYALSQEVATLYVKAYTSQEKIQFFDEELQQLKADLARGQLKLASGEAAQSDLNKMEASIRELTRDVASQERSLESSKSRLTQLIKKDITVGFRFEDPFCKADIKRSALKQIMDHTLENDQAYYEAKMNTTANRISLEMNETLMKQQYGSKMDLIQGYVNQAKNGQEIDGNAFKNSYNQFLANIDKPWSFKIRILFFKFSAEWFKGAIDGSRFVEDDPYALYTSALDYVDAYEEQEKAKQQLEASVLSGYENVITATNAYTSLAESNELLKKELDRAMIKNRLGELPYEELSSLQEEFRDYEMEQMDLLAEYTMLLTSFDRLTCGAVSLYLEDSAFLPDSTGGGDSFVAVDTIEGAYYYIESKVEDNIFVFGISIPDDFEIQVTDYELWVNGVQIGERVNADKQIRHLALDLESVESAEVHLYENEELKDICQIDSSVNRAQLLLKDNYRVEETQEERKVASFTYLSNHETQLTEIKLNPEAGENIAAYQIVNEEGKAVYQDKVIDINNSFSYLTLITSDLGRLTIQFYDAGGSLLYQGRFDTMSGNIYVKE